MSSILGVLINGMCLFKDEMKPPSANLQSGLLTDTHSKRTYTTTLPFRRRNTSHCSNGVAVEATNKVYCLAPHLFSQSLTAQALFALKIRRTRTQTAIPCECLLGEGVLCTQADMFEQYGRDALNNTFGECVVAKANEVDCFANAEVQSPKGRGDVLFRVHAVHSFFIKHFL